MTLLKITVFCESLLNVPNPCDGVSWTCRKCVRPISCPWVFAWGIFCYNVDVQNLEVLLDFALYHRKFGDPK